MDSAGGGRAFLLRGPDPIHPTKLGQLSWISGRNKGSRPEIVPKECRLPRWGEAFGETVAPLGRALQPPGLPLMSPCWPCFLQRCTLLTYSQLASLAAGNTAVSRQSESAVLTAERWLFLKPVCPMCELRKPRPQRQRGGTWAVPQMDGSGAGGQLGFLLFEAGMDHAFNSEGNRAEDLEGPSVPRWERSGCTGTCILEALLNPGGSHRDNIPGECDASKMTCPVSLCGSLCTLFCVISLSVPGLVRSPRVHPQPCCGEWGVQGR